ncbi:MAG: type VI secretion system baseplate subunit TssK [Prevotella sp.]|nr:type VI secretion system baseplate subunit TssK [Prevotella sp.]
MPRNISWKKGMRLTDEVLFAADACTAEAIAQALTLGACGRFGLISSTERPFQIQLSVAKGFVDVEVLSCMAITKGGHIIDAHFDTKFTNTFDGRVQIPADLEQKEYFLTINARPGQWKETAEGYREPDYSFALIGPQTKLPADAMPIARIVYEDGWREDATKFVPPCLTITAHPKFEELHMQLLQLLRKISDTTSQQLDTAARTAISIYWPVVQQCYITAATEHDTMTPQQLQGCVQRMVGAFALACQMDEVLNLEDGPVFSNYALMPYSYTSAYQRIRQGLGMCYAISEKVEKFSLLKIEPKPEPAPLPPPPEPAPTPEPVKPTPPPAFDPKRFWDGKRI